MAAGLQYIATGLMVGGIYALVALAIVLIYKATGIFNFAIGNMMMVGAFVCWALMTQFGINPWIAVLLAVGAGALIGWAVNRFTMNPLIGQPILAPVMVTLALAYFFDGLTILLWGGSIRSLPDFLPGDRFHLGPAVLSSDLMWAFLIAILVFGILVLFFQKSRVGLAMRATAESHLVARARGIKVERIFGITWAISAAMAALCGIVLAARMGLEITISVVGLKAFPAVIFGGMESILGAMVGGLTVGLLENLAGGFISTWFMEVTPYIVLLLVLIIKPQGLFGEKRIERI
jgi:branched-chain amino acid transport system permease protein